jgi:hypothetical protein
LIWLVLLHLFRVYSFGEYLVNLRLSQLVRIKNLATIRYIAAGKPLSKQTAAWVLETYLMDGAINLAIFNVDDAVLYWNLFGCDLFGRNEAADILLLRERPPRFHAGGGRRGGRCGGGLRLLSLWPAEPLLQRKRGSADQGDVYGERAGPRVVARGKYRKQFTLSWSGI